MPRIMYDAITPSRIPHDGDIYASYVNGKWPNYPQLATLFPGKRYLSISVSADTDADCLDVERYDATPEQAPAWAQRQRDRGNPYPWVYMNQSTWPFVTVAFTHAKIAQPLYWVANYDSNGTIPYGAVAIQYKNRPSFDQSNVLDYIPGWDDGKDDIVTPDQMKQLQSYMQDVVRNNARWLQTVVKNQIATLQTQIEDLQTQISHLMK